MNWDKFFRRCYLALGIFIFILFFEVLFPWTMKDYVLNDYQLLRAVVNSSVNFENQRIEQIEIPPNVSLIAAYNDDQTTYLKAKYYYNNLHFTPDIEYSIKLSPNYEILETSPDEMSFRAYMFRTIGLTLLFSAISGLILPLPIMLVLSCLLDLFSKIRDFVSYKFVKTFSKKH